MDQKHSQFHNTTEFSLKDLVEILWRGRALILSITLLTTLITGVTAWMIPRTFDATIVIAPAADTSTGLMSGSGAFGQLSGLAAMAGMATSGDSKKAESLAVLQSEALTEKYISDNNLLPVLFATRWDPVAKQWKTTDPDKIPTLWKGNEYFRDKVRMVTTNPKSGLVTMTISWTDPALAAKWANEMVRATNNYLGAMAIAQSTRNISYLGEEATKTDVLGVKQAIYTLLESEINKMMLARGNEEYAFRVLDRAVPPERASAPRRLLWLLGGLVGGLTLSVLVVLVRNTRVS